MDHLWYVRRGGEREEKIDGDDMKYDCKKVVWENVRNVVWK